MKRRMLVTRVDADFNYLGIKVHTGEYIGMDDNGNKFIFTLFITKNEKTVVKEFIDKNWVVSYVDINSKLLPIEIAQLLWVKHGRYVRKFRTV